jgi:serine/threonine-protein kinase RIO1
MHSILQQYPCASVHEALKSPLPFQIPLTDFTLVQYSSRRDHFVYARSDISHAVDGWLLHQLSGNSEMAVTTLDGHWILFIENCCAASIHRDQAHSSSVPRTRPDTTICKNGAVVLKHEAKAVANDLDEAEEELVDKLFPEALKQFSQGSEEIVGITTCASEVKLYRIYFASESKTFNKDVLQSYPMNSVDGRISFIIDIAKLCRWIVGVVRPNSKFHLVLNVRTETKNKHHITWCKEGLLKEFKRYKKTSRDGGNVSQQSMAYIHHIHALKLANVEWGRPVQGSEHAVMITRVGRRVSDALRDGMLKQVIYDGVVAGVQQLHAHGFAHCDISISNVFIDDKGLAFLDDLEYLTPLKDPPPHKTRIPTGSDVSTAEQLDYRQLETFSLELQSLL